MNINVLIIIYFYSDMEKLLECYRIIITQKKKANLLNAKNSVFVSSVSNL